MTPKSYFDNVWRRADLFGALYAYISANMAAALDPSELLRAEWATRVSALDLYVHELVAQRLLEIFQGVRPACPGFSRIQVNAETVVRIRNAGSTSDGGSAFDLDMRNRLARATFQYPEDIADGIRMVSSVELWNEIAKYYGAKGASVVANAKALKRKLSQVVDRRNKIVHEGDMQPVAPRIPWTISRSDVDEVNDIILRVVNGIEAVV